MEVNSTAKKSALALKPRKSTPIKGSRRSAVAINELVLDLAAPGLTPLLRAGLGGLASALRVLAIENDARVRWAVPVQIADGTATVESRRIVFRFGPKGFALFLETLFARVFKISREGAIAPRGVLDPLQPIDLGLLIALQLGMKRTFLQHGKSTTKVGSAKALNIEIDERTFRYNLQPYNGFAHQGGAAWVAEALEKGAVELAGWAYPGASQKHVRLKETKCDYGPVEAVCALFALIGCISLPLAHGGGALVIPHVTDLVAFAITRPRLNPRRVAEAHVTGLGDAVLGMNLALRLDDVAKQHGGVSGADGLLLRPLPWATQQKSRASTLSLDRIDDARLDIYDAVCRTLPARIRESADQDEDDQADGFFVATSALRGFVTDNLAEHRSWYAGFATATTGGKKPRFIHCYRDMGAKGDLGALYPEDKKGLITMLDNLEHAEQTLVRSVHIALRQRFAQIADQRAQSIPSATIKKRWQDERDRLRFAFSGAKTSEQIRAALADLWSRAGSNRELRNGWEQVLPLLRSDRWQAARDLALVALASYQRQNAESEGEEENLARPDSQEQR
jgi:CRISPR-associated protein Cas8a1/Csx13